MHTIGVMRILKNPSLQPPRASRKFFMRQASHAKKLRNPVGDNTILKFKDSQLDKDDNTMADSNKLAIAQIHADLHAAMSKLLEIEKALDKALEDVKAEKGAHG